MAGSSLGFHGLPWPVRCRLHRAGQRGGVAVGPLFEHSLLGPAKAASYTTLRPPSRPANQACNTEKWPLLVLLEVELEKVLAKLVAECLVKYHHCPPDALNERQGQVVLRRAAEGAEHVPEP